MRPYLLRRIVPLMILFLGSGAGPFKLNPAQAQTIPFPSHPMPQEVLLDPANSPTTTRPLGVQAEPSRNDVLTARATPARRVVLGNGLTILIKEAPAHDFVALELLCRVGLQNEDTPQSGLIALWERLLSERLESATSAAYRVKTSVSAEPDFLRFTLIGRSEDLPSMLEALSYIIINDHYDEAMVGKEKRKLKEAIESGTGPNNQLYSIFRALFYRFHPYRRQYTSGVLALERISASTIEDFHRRYLVSDRMVLAVVGRLSRASADDELRRTLGDIKSQPIQDLSIAWEAKPVEKHIDLNTSANLGWVLVGYPAPPAGSDDHMPMMVIRMILSEGLSSRLFNEVREKKGLSYTIASVHPDLRGPSHFLTYIVTKPADTGKVRREVLKATERLRDELLTPDELAYAKEKVRGAVLLERETVSGLAFRLARAESIGLGYLYEENFERNLSKVTAAEVRRVAQAYLVKPTIIIARPAGRLYFDS